ncbi:MAG: ABC transporter ATP-binding protein, partial [Natrialbaceae archaeon]
VTIFFSSHILSEVRRLCDRVGIIRQGRLVTVEPIETLLQQTGKVVRVDGAEPIPTAVLDVDGVHDLQTAPPRDGDDAAEDHFSECAFTFTGDINAVLDALSGYELLDISIEEAPLEDVFMRFYGGEDGV